MDITAIRRTRREFLALGGAVALGGVLAACGGDSSDDSADAGGFVVAPRFPRSKSQTPGQLRLALSLADTKASLLTTGPDTLTGAVLDGNGATIAEFEAPRRGTGLSVPYWAVTTTVSAPGLYGLRIDGAIGDPESFQVFDPGEVTVPSTGSVLPPFDTPTLADARGVDPVCTRSGGPCPFHEVTLTDAIAAGKPVVYLIGTPAHCQFATCGPGLDFLIAASARYADTATFVHAEVYSNPEGTAVAPAVDAAGLDYEPVIWITDATGTVTRRIDIVWDQTDLDAMLASALS